ncbi:MAG: hypothetical protein JWR32_506 [Mycobacterium sp.]|jgi:hypothetical protein|nr:hypothetical protein [Mycobacterium sp.]
MSESRRKHETLREARAHAFWRARVERRRPELNGVGGKQDDDAAGSCVNRDCRGVIDVAFQLLDQIGTLEPVRLLDLAVATGIPRPTVHRLLQQLIAVGAVRRDGTRYRLGPSLLDLGARVTPERRLRAAARRPMAELAAATGAAVSLTAMIGDHPIYLETVEPRVPLAFVPEPGAQVPPGTAQARIHAESGGTGPIIDAGGVLTNLSCVAVPVPLSTGGVAAVTTLVAHNRPPPGLLAATRITAARIARFLGAPPAPPWTVPERSPSSGL